VLDFRWTLDREREMWLVRACVFVYCITCGERQLGPRDDDVSNLHSHITVAVTNFEENIMLL
jgi:hypothetical protein